MPRPYHNRIKLAMDILKTRTDNREWLAKVHENGNKTACTTAVLAFYGIGKNQFKFCQTTQDVTRHLNRHGWSAVNVGKQKENKKVIGKAVKNLNKFISRSGYYLVSTCNHVLLAYLSDSGEISFPVDTCPDYNRRIESIHKIVIKK